jgi:hypothetical protein
VWFSNLGKASAVAGPCRHGSVRGTAASCREVPPACRRRGLVCRRGDPGWLFLTGAPDDIEELRYSLGFSDPDPLVDRDQTTHTGMLRIGNDAYQRWTMAPALAEPRQILGTINHVSRTLTF